MMTAQDSSPDRLIAGATHEAQDVSLEMSLAASVACELADGSEISKKSQQPTSRRITDPKRKLVLLLGFFALVPFSVGIACWQIAGPWTQHQCSTHIAQLSPPLLFDVNNATFILDPNLSHPVTSGTISVELLLWTSLLLPLLVLLIIPSLAYYMRYRCRKATATTGAFTTKPDATATTATLLVETVAAISAFLTAWLLTEMATSLGKTWVHRPNFYSLCEMDVQTMQCTSSSLHRICDSYYSLPSGHSSLSACAMVFVICCIVGQMMDVRRRTIRNEDYGTTKQRIVLASLATWILLGSWAVYVAATRVHDHWHRVSDVSAGLALGTGISLVVYLAYSYYFGCGQWNPHYSSYGGMMAPSLTATTTVGDDDGTSRRVYEPSGTHQPDCSDDDASTTIIEV